MKIITKIKNEVKPLIKENKSKSNVYKKAMYCTNIGRNKIIEKYTLFLPVVINDLKLIILVAENKVLTRCLVSTMINF